MMPGNKHALVVEDNADLARLVQLHLHDINLHADIANDGRTAIKMFTDGNYDMLVLDIMLPELDGLEVCKHVRQHNNQIPILMLTAKTEEIDKVVGLEIGADDYLTKPFGGAELTARIKALLRRADLTGPSAQFEDVRIVKSGPLKMDLSTRLVTAYDQRVSLTVTEFELLAHFVQHPGKVFTRAELLEQVW